MLKQIGRYELLEEIASGGMATVFRGRDITLDRLVAVKVMHPHLRGAEQARERFAREARTVAKLHHPNIIEIYDFSGAASEEVHIVTELLTGPTLKVFAEEHPNIPAEIAACICVLLARALHTAHIAGVIHRDVKPENVLIHKNATVKLTDFGLAQMRDTHSMTITGQVLGSPGHMAPEQVEGHACDARSDIFSLGTVLYLLAVGRLPFNGRNPHKVLMQITKGEYPDPLRMRPSVGSKMTAIINRCLKVDPNERYPDAAALESDLMDFVSDIGIDDVGAELETFLKAPEQTGQRINENVVAVLAEKGIQAANEGQRSLASDYFNRVLALDPENQKVMAALSMLARRSRRKRWLRFMTAIVLTIALGAGVFALSQYAMSEKHVQEKQRTVSAKTVEVSSDDSSEQKTLHSEPESSDEQQEIEQPPKAQREQHDVLPRLRRVQFQPTPQNIKISVDGGPLEAFGPDFRYIDLSPGRHSFHFVGASGCCEDSQLNVNIKAGRMPFVLKHRLTFRPAMLIVRSNVPSDVAIKGDGRGRSHGLITVDLNNQYTAVKEIEVSTEGFLPQRRSVVLQAGQVSEISVKLDPE
ncbi:MAG: serine/threonine protein kinase [Myxococcales bacterium]|nr:MAG: serine/threonine protein kinase [Myxococcales bacterium]